MRQDGSRVDVSVRAQPITFEGRQVGTYVTFFDITEKKREKLELREAKEAAEAASVAKSMFLANTSHEIRTPLNAILGTADLLDETELTPDQRQFVDILGSAGQTLLDLVNDVLDLSKIEAGGLELDAAPFRLDELVEEVVDVFAIHAHQKSLELVGRLGNDVPAAVVGDATRLRQVLLNLLGNAVKFTDRGEVGLSVQVAGGARDADAPVRLDFEVWDTGPGIPLDARTRVFERFTQADPSTTRKHGGTGLGLTICRSLVELMGGEMKLESEVGAGSTFSFRLAFPVPSQVPEPLDTLDVDLTGLRALVVDDSSTNRLILREILGSWGAEVVEAERGGASLERLKEASDEGAPFDLVLLDGHMPEMDGFEVAERISSDPEFRAATILMITSLDRPGDLARSRDLAVDSYMVKPVQRGSLARRLSMVLQTSDRAAKGTTAAKAADRPDPEPAEEGRVAPDRSFRVLIAEDVEDNRLLVDLYLKDTGHEVIMVENGQEAVEAFQTRGPFDIVFMDIQMPEMDGYDATRAIRSWEEQQRRPRTPIVALTAHALQEQEGMSYEAGCDEHMTKPVRKNQLLQAMYRHAGGGGDG
jgi:signal transduction histidine kinase/CheY-like chemotaxis protein